MQPHKILALGYRAAIPMLGPQVVSFAAKWLYLATTSRYSSSVQRVAEMASALDQRMLSNQASDIREIRDGLTLLGDEMRLHQ